MLKNLLKIQAQLSGNKSNQIFASRSFSDTKCLFQSAPAPPKAAGNSLLYKLRKSTGYGMSKCKEALEKTNNNIEEVIRLLYVL